MGMSELVYVNGQLVAYEDALLPIEDRATMFADGVYEVIRFYSGKPFMMRAHINRLGQSATAIGIQSIDPDELIAAGLELAQKNDIGDGNLYIQLSRGVARRNHAFPGDMAPTWFMTARDAKRPSSVWREEGISCVTTPDIRWHRCDIKSVSLLPNVLAKQQAVQAGCVEALFVRDGQLTEGSSSNLFGVKGGIVYTYPDSPLILSGITRKTVLHFLSQEGIPVRFEPMSAADIEVVDELFLTGTNTEIMGIVRVDETEVADGQVGPVTKRLQSMFDQVIDAVVNGGRVDFDGERFVVEH